MNPNVGTIPVLSPIIASILLLTEQTCCRFQKYGYTIAADHIPRDWRIELRAYRNQGCDESSRKNFYYRGTQTNKGCAEYGAWSAGYGINTFNKRSNTANGDECQPADFMGLGDGTLYNITAMGETLTEQLLSYENATGSADVPKLFKEFEFTV